jgi:predicted DNA-binding transcriptional regulator AlpA
MNSQNDGRPKPRPKREAWPRGLRRPDAASYLGISPSQFDKWVVVGTVPSPKKIGGVVLWDRFALDDAMEAIFYPEAEAEMAIWDEVRA